jgi:hypothetical protein
MLSKAAKPLNEWVREGTSTEGRLKAFRNLECAEGGKMAFLVVSALVKVAMGHKKMRPYGEAASVSTKDFQDVSDAQMGLTLAAMYPFVKMEQSSWNQVLRTKNKKNCAHPVTGLWHVNTVSRFLNFISTFRANRKELFQIYEKEGGVYHGQNQVNPRARRALITEADVQDFDEDSEFV